MAELTQHEFTSDLAASTNRVYLDCLTITHSQIETIRIVNDAQSLARASGIYLGFPFEVKLPAQTSERPPQLEITIDIVDQRIMAAMRSLRGLREGADITIEIVPADAPNEIKFGPATFGFLDFKTDGVAVGTLTGAFMPGSLNDAYPRGRFSPSNARAL